MWYTRDLSYDEYRTISCMRYVSHTPANVALQTAWFTTKSSFTSTFTEIIYKTLPAFDKSSLIQNPYQLKISQCSLSSYILNVKFSKQKMKFLHKLYSHS